MSVAPNLAQSGLRRWGAILAFALAAWLVLAGGATARDAALIVDIDLTSQRMRVDVDSGALHVWPVSTGRRGYPTPRGRFSPIRLEAKWYSRKYDNAPMPHSIFFHAGYAIPGTTEIRNLGRRASHGCVRLHPDNARILFDLVRQYGAANTLIVIHP